MGEGDQKVNKEKNWAAWLSQSVHHATLDFAVEFKPHSGCRNYLKSKIAAAS